MQTQSVKQIPSEREQARLLATYRCVERAMMHVLQEAQTLTHDSMLRLIFSRHAAEDSHHVSALVNSLFVLKLSPGEDVLLHAELLSFLRDVREGVGDLLILLTGVYRVVKPQLAAAYETGRAWESHLIRNGADAFRLFEWLHSQERQQILWGEKTLKRLTRKRHDREQVEARPAYLERRLEALGGLDAPPDGEGVSMWKVFMEDPS